ncbi:MAG: hypothetical protein JWO38_4539 [Gemmataceae bacterium]|nr:hypothetical protein [Gemmataceae bacterium]
MGKRRPKTPTATETKVLLDSGRRCCLCYGLHNASSVKTGQIAHIDQDNTNNHYDNLAFLCLEHHNLHDSKTSQAKNFTPKEVKHYRDKLYVKISKGIFALDSFPSGPLRVVDMDFLESRLDRINPESTPFFMKLDSVSPAILKEMAPVISQIRSAQYPIIDPDPKPGELPVLDIKLRNTSSEPAFIKKAVFHIKQAWKLMAFHRCYSQVTISTNYNVLIPRLVPPYDVDKAISQSLDGGGVDRIAFTLYPEAINHIIYASVDLIYDEDDKIANAGDILFAVRDYDSEFVALSEEEVKNEANEFCVLNSTAMDGIKLIKAARSNVVRAFEAGAL